MDPILERPDNWITKIYEWGDNILYNVSDYFNISYYDLCTIIFVYSYIILVIILLLIICYQQFKKSRKKLRLFII